MPQQTIKVDSVAEAYLALLKDRGVDYIFGNAGTDFPSIIEGLAKAISDGGRAPTPITVPHENLGVAMAHGFYLATGRPQAVMVHVNVGTANALCGIINAQRENVPILFTSGRTPITETGAPGARSLFIHWGQEMFDQASMVREMVKWDYELRNARQLETVVDRAVTLAMTGSAKRSTRSANAGTAPARWPKLAVMTSGFSAPASHSAALSIAAASAAGGDAATWRAGES